jgi:hypothetical protein
MIAIIYSILWIAVAFKFADRKWLPYYPTLLFASLGNLLYELLCYKYHLWQMEPNGLPVVMIPVLLLTFIGMPASTWVYLSRYPFRKGISTQVLYIAFFTIVFILLEFVAVKYGSITYHHNWNLWWSLVFVVIMFIVLRIHYLRPLLALVISVVIIVSFSLIFHVSLDKMK